MLIIFGGLSGVGKTTIARKLSQALDAIYLRIDTIETAITTSQLNVRTAENAGYLVAYELAKDNLLLGRMVIADSVNPISITREAWHETARSAGKDFLEIEIICSDKNEHKRRVETRIADIKGHILPTWKEVLDREYSVWELQGIQVDTANCTPNQNVAEIKSFLLQHISRTQ